LKKNQFHQKLIFNGLKNNKNILLAEPHI